MPDILKDYFCGDSATIKKAVLTPQGFLKCDAVVVARTGVLTYHVLPDGTPGLRRDFVSADELSRPDSLATLKMVPVTNEHPPVSSETPNGFINANTAKKYTVGYVGENVNVDSGNLVVSLVITDAATIRQVQAGKRQLSCAYLNDLVKTPGTFAGETYDYMQTNRRYNHIALTSSARAGDVATINLDSNEPHKDNLSLSQRSFSMPVPITINGIVYADQAPEVAAHIASLDSKIAALSGEKTTLKANLDSMTAARDTEKAKADTATAKVAELPTLVAAGVKARAALEAKCLPHLDAADKPKISDLADIDLRKKIATKAFPNLKETIAGANEAYLTPCFDSAIEVLTTNPNGMASQRKEANGGGTPNADSAPVDYETARQKMIERNSNLYKDEPAKK